MIIEITLTEEMLGTKAANPEVFASFIASKHPSGTAQRDELDQPENKEEAGTTIFHAHEGQKGIYDYQVKGFFKDACAALNRCDKDERAGLEKLPAFKSKIDGVIFVEPRFIPFALPPESSYGICERPLRAETAQGPRVTVCRSETVPVGTVLRFNVKIMSKELRPYVVEWLNYGALRGLGQWRNSGKGRFTWTEVK